MLGFLLVLLNLHHQESSLDKLIYVLHLQNKFEKSRNTCLKEEVCLNHTLFKKSILKPSKVNAIECLDKALSPAPFRNDHSCNLENLEVPDAELYVHGNLACKKCNFMASKAKVWVFGDLQAENLIARELIILAVGKIQINKLLGEKVLLFSSSKEIFIENCAQSSVFSSTPISSSGNCEGSLKFVEGAPRKLGIISNSQSF